MEGFAEYQKQLSKIHVAKNFTRDQIAFGIWLRFGSLTDDSQVFHSFNDIRYMTGISQPSMVRLIKKWRSLNKNMTMYPTKITRNRWHLTPEMEQWIVQPDTLQGMAALTHVQRAAAICRRFGLRSFCVNSMLKLYRRHGITLGQAPPAMKDMAETHGTD